MKIQIQTAFFKAVMHFRAIADIRYHINGVYLETGSEGARLVATTGQVLCVGKVDDQDHPIAGIIIPKELCQVVKLLRKEIRHITLTFADGVLSVNSSSWQARTIGLAHGGHISEAKEILGAYPQYRRALPKALTGIAGEYDPKHLTLLHRAAQELEGKHAFYPGIAQNGDACALSVISDSLFAVVMPRRNNRAKHVIPAWANSKHNITAPVKPKSHLGKVLTSQLPVLYRPRCKCKQSTIKPPHRRLFFRSPISLFATQTGMDTVPELRK